MKKIASLLGVIGFCISILTWIRLNNTDKIFTERYKRLTETDLKILKKLRSINQDLLNKILFFFLTLRLYGYII